MIWLAALAVAVVLLVVAEWRGHASRALWKPVASSLFLWGGWQNHDGSAFATAILAGLILGALGDVLLLGRGRWFLAGLSVFLVGHLAYAAALMMLGTTWWSVVVAIGMFWVAARVLYWLWPHLATRMQGPVVAYVANITVMVAASPTEVRLFAAALAFAASDIFVARNRFVARDWRNRAIGLPLYYGAQATFAISPNWV